VTRLLAREVGKRQDAAPVAETEHARASVPSARVVTHSHFDDGSELIVVGSKGFRSSSGAGGDERRQDFQGRPAQGEEDVLQVCRALRAALVLQGEIWGPFSRAPSQDDVDAVARDDAGAELRVQVTQVERDAWKTLARTRQATSQRSAKELAADIRIAVESKAKKHAPAQRSKLLLALDAIRAPGHVHEPVPATFLADHGQWAASLDYQAIWLVGPTAELTRRLG
jgi:hypothetical protein